MGVISNGTTMLDAGALDGSLPTDSTVLLATTTLNNTATVSFTGLSNTYKEHLFVFNIHPVDDNDALMMNFSDDASSHSYNLNKTTNLIRAIHGEDGSSGQVNNRTAENLGNATGDVTLHMNIGGDNDQGGAGWVRLFYPTDPSHMKTFQTCVNSNSDDNFSQEMFATGYIHQTAATTAVQFKMSTQNFSTGFFKHYGIK